MIGCSHALSIGRLPVPLSPAFCSERALTEGREVVSARADNDAVQKGEPRCWCSERKEGGASRRVRFLLHKQL